MERASIRSAVQIGSNIDKHIVLLYHVYMICRYYTSAFHSCQVCAVPNDDPQFSRARLRVKTSRPFLEGWWGRSLSRPCPSLYVEVSGPN